MGERKILLRPFLGSLGKALDFGIFWGRGGRAAGPTDEEGGGSTWHQIFILGRVYHVRFFGGGGEETYVVLFRQKLAHLANLTREQPSDSSDLTYFSPQKRKKKHWS